MKTIFVFALLLMGCLLSCAPESIDVRIVGSNDTIPLIENRLNLSIGDTCIVEKHWLNYFDGTYYREEYKTVTKIESERRLKTAFVWAAKGTPRERLVEGAVYQLAVVVKKY